MTAPRLIQNFRHCRAMLWAGSDFNAEILERTLRRLGLTLCRVEHVNGADLDADRDVLFIDADQGIDASLLIPPGSTLPNAPAIGLVGVEAPSRLKLLADVGATAMLRKPVQGAMIYSALFLGVNTYRRLRSAETRLAVGDRKRRGRRLLIKAVVALVQARGLDDEEAYAELRRESMRRRLDVEQFCEALFQPGSPFPSAWPIAPAHPSETFNTGEDSHAQDADVGRRDGGRNDESHGGVGGGPHQARRA